MTEVFDSLLSASKSLGSVSGCCAFESLKEKCVDLGEERRDSLDLWCSSPPEPAVAEQIFLLDEEEYSGSSVFTAEEGRDLGKRLSVLTCEPPHPLPTERLNSCEVF